MTLEELVELDAFLLADPDEIEGVIVIFAEVELVDVEDEELDDFAAFFAWLHSDIAFWKENFNDWQASPFPRGMAAAIEAFTAKLISLE